jgi:hypothetical protein
MVYAFLVDVETGKRYRLEPQKIDQDPGPGDLVAPHFQLGEGTCGSADDFVYDFADVNIKVCATEGARLVAHYPDGRLQIFIIGDEVIDLGKPSELGLGSLFVHVEDRYGSRASRAAELKIISSS